MATQMTLAPAKVEYPSSDGRPVAESDHQFIPLTYAANRLREHFRDREDVYVAGNLLIYYEEGNLNACVAPDVFVVLGAARGKRSNYRLWEERKIPDFVLEVTSRSTRYEDQGKKRRLYQRLGVREYWQYDPTGDYLEPPLQGLELRAGRYRPLPRRELADGTVVLASEALGLELRLTDRGLRFHDPVTGHDLPDLAETDAAWRRAEQARQEAETRLAQADRRIAELEALLRRSGRDGSAQHG